MEKAKVVLDLSKWNVIRDYTKLTNGIDGVILRIGYRSLEKGIITEDPKFTTHLNGLQKTKTPIGVYFFTTAITEAEARKEAEWVVDRIKKDNITLSFPIAVDTEYSNEDKTGRSDKLSKNVRTTCVLAFCKRIEELGYRPMIYASDDWFISQLDYDKVKPYLKWVARYSTKAPEKVKDCLIGWQCTNNFNCAGSDSGVDMSEWYGPIKVAYSLKGKVEEDNITVESATDETNKIVAGSEVKLVDEPLFKASTTNVSAKLLSGTYYYWDDQIKEGKIRITSKKEYVGMAAKVTGWISVK